MSSQQQRLKLTSDRRGYTVDGAIVDGFAHRAEFAPDAQVKLARWASQLDPENLSPEQRQLLAEEPERRPSRRRESAAVQERALESPLTRALWATLDKDRQSLVLDPEQALEGKGYPLSTGELAHLTGLTVRQIQYATEGAVLPYWQNDCGHRRFEAAGAIIALALAGASQPERQFFGGIANRPAPLAHARRSMALVSYCALARPEKLDDQELDATLEQLKLMTAAVKRVRDRAQHPEQHASGGAGKASAF